VNLFAKLRQFAWPFGRARSSHPVRPLDPLAAGVRSLNRGHAAEALTFFEFASAEALTDAQRAIVDNKRGVAHVRLGDRAAALAAFTAALAADPRAVPAITNIGNLLLEDGAVDEAIVHYEAALRIDDGYALAHLSLGVAYKRLGRRGEAVREFRRAHRLERIRVKNHAP
jgi:tetratricopeptide (TPR) repeat protein